jgi:hypothetical protein
MNPANELHYMRARSHLLGYSGREPQPTAVVLISLGDPIEEQDSYPLYHGPQYYGLVLFENERIVYLLHPMEEGGTL